MTPRRGASLYLARRSYRRRRLIDAARLLPLMGVVLFLLPLLWAPAEAPETATARQGLYVLAVWFALVVAALVLARRLPRGDDGRDDESEDAPAPGSGDGSG